MSSRRRHTICALVTGVQTCALPIKYSPVDGATANALADHVPAEMMEDRYHRCMEKQQAISAAKLQRKVGQTIEVLVDEINEDAASVEIGRASCRERVCQYVSLSVVAV